MTAEKKNDLKWLAIVGFTVSVLSFVGAIAGTWGTMRFFQGQVTTEIATLKMNQADMKLDISHLNDKIIGEKRFEEHCQQNAKDMDTIQGQLKDMNNNIMTYIYEVQKRERASR
jgi:thiamine phosphate synthase YjbQ (UPF0047 family)